MSDNANYFPSRAPIGLMFAAAMALACVILTFTVWHRQLSPLESFYLKKYVSPEGSSLLAKFRKPGTLKRYRVLVLNGVVATTQTVQFAPPEKFSIEEFYSQPKFFHEWLTRQVYSGVGPIELVKTPALLSSASILLSLITGLVFESRRKKKAREGEQLRGQQLVTPREFNRSQKGVTGFVIRIK